MIWSKGSSIVTLCWRASSNGDVKWLSTIHIIHRNILMAKENCENGLYSQGVLSVRTSPFFFVWFGQNSFFNAHKYCCRKKLNYQIWFLLFIIKSLLNKHWNEVKLIMSSQTHQTTYVQHKKLQHITVRHLLPVAAPCPEPRCPGSCWILWRQLDLLEWGS